MRPGDEKWQRPQHPVSDDELRQLRDGGIFGNQDAVSASPLGVVVDDAIQQPYAFCAKQVARAAQLGIRITASIPWKYEEYFDHQGQPQLCDSIVCQLDILGTGSESDTDVAAQLRITRTAIAGAHRWTDEGVELIARWFTDNAVVAALDTEWRSDFALSTLSLVCAAMQLELVGHGRFSRGGIAAGPFHASDLFAYGAPLRDAYDLESHVALYPRTVFSSSLRRRLLDDPDPGSILDAVVAVDHDDRAFVSYLGPLTDPQSDKDPEATLRSHRDAIRRHLADASYSERVKAKYGWAADYHDRFCVRWFRDLDVRVHARDVAPLVGIRD